MSLNEQFNQQYDDMIETVKSRAIWRVGEYIAEGDTFRCHCFNCGYESLHQRFDITRHRLLLGKSIRAIEPPRPMLRCRRCGHQQHLRDVGELVVPSTIALHDDLRDAVIAHLQLHPATSDLPADVVERITAFREQASGPVRQLLLTSLAKSVATPSGADALLTLEAVGRELFLSADQIQAAIAARAESDTD